MPSSLLARSAALVVALALALLAGAPAGAEAANPCNPCGAKPAANPCGDNPAAANPCSGNPCGANPCGGTGGVDPGRFQRPEGVEVEGDGDLVARGESLWNDTSLSTNGAACATCHAGYAQFLASFAKPYPHEVEMVKAQSGVAEIEAAEMVQFCMLQPMQAEPLAWSSRDLAALTAYVEHLQEDFAPNPCGTTSANPCNPCGANPCGGNPCGR